MMEQYEEYARHAEKIYFSENNIIRTQIELEKQKEKAGSKQNLAKKSESPLKLATRPSHSSSNRQIEDKIKNSSV